MNYLFSLNWLLVLGTGFLAPAGPSESVRPRREFVYGTAGAAKATFSYDGRLVAVSGSGSGIGVFQSRTAILVNEFQKHRKPVTTLTTWPGRDTIVSADAGGMLLCWRPRSGQLIKQIQLPWTVQMVCPQPGGQSIAVLSKAGAWLVDMGTGTRQLLPAASIRQMPTTLRFNASGNQLAVGYGDGSVTVCTLPSHQVRTTRLFKTPVHDLLFQGDSLLAVAGTPAVVYWHFNSSAANASWQMPVRQPVWCISQQTNHPERTVFLGLADGGIVQYNPVTQQEKLVGQAKAVVQGVFVNPREGLLLATYQESPPKTWLLE